MRLIFLFGPPAAGKLTVGRIVAERTGFALFHNHLVVDAVAALFPFGSPEFVRLREHFWMEAIGAAAHAGQSLIFTFNPEPSVAANFPACVAELVSQAGGEAIFVALTVNPVEQEQRIDHAARAEFGKLRSIDLLRDLRPSMLLCEAQMPTPSLVIDTTVMTPDTAADAIVGMLAR
jgi:hypothetical protein